MLNLLMLSLEETLLQLTKSLIHIGKHAAMNMKMCLYYPCSSCITNAAINMKLYFYYPCCTCITNGVSLYIITDNSWYIDALGISHA